MSETSTTTADDVRAVAYIVEDIEALGVHVASASWVGYTDHPLTVQVSGDEAAVATVYRLIATGELPTVHVGARQATRIEESAIAAYVTRNRRERKAESA